MMDHWFQMDRDKQEIIISLPGKAPLKINKKDMEISFFSGGPGGQNVNRNMNGVRLIYVIPSNYLFPFQKTRELVTRSINHRQQEQNFKDAFEALAEKLKRYFYLPPERRETSIPKKSKENRLKDKKRRASIKQDRKRVEY